MECVSGIEIKRCSKCNSFGFWLIIAILATTISQCLASNVNTSNSTISSNNNNNNLLNLNSRTFLRKLKYFIANNELEIVPGVYFREKQHVGRSFSKDDDIFTAFQKFIANHEINVEMSRTSQSGRLFFFKGLKKFMWPLMIGFQLVKTVLLVLFLPSIIGSVGQIVGKGLPTLSGFAHQAQTVNDLEFRDNYENSENEQNNKDSAGYEYTPAGDAMSRLGIIERRKVTYDNPTQVMDMKHFLTRKDNFKQFHDIPNSSLLLTNYDPFYSPLLSRLDAVFQQLNLGKNSNEKCRERIICMMYSNPAKFAPYSNLVSAQLSRELNELRKPIADNADIMRFFKYMKAAKDGQDGVNCDVVYSGCSSYKDMVNPAMVNTFNDINKLVHARKI